MATQIGAQLFTLRDHCKTVADFTKTCARLKDMGFGAVQVSAVGIEDPAEIKKVLDDHGLVCAATHYSLDNLKDSAKALDYHRTLDCELTAIGGFGHGGRSKEEWSAFAKQYSDISKSLAPEGLRVGYHNHSHELAPFGLADHPEKIDPCETPMQLIFDECDDAVWFEIDVYWIAHGGADPALWIEKCNGRIPAIHVKDMTITPDREQKMCEVGAGNLNWPTILTACKRAGVKWYLIERDRGDLDPFDSLKISLENLRSWGLE